MMRALLRLYPPAWRVRYGEEFSALLDDQNVSIATIVDIILGALDAHLYGGRNGVTLATRVRDSAAAAIAVGSLLWLLTALPYVGMVQGGSWVLVALPLGAVLVALGLLSLGLLQRNRRAVIATLATLSALGLVANAAMTVWVLSMGIVFVGGVPGWLAPMAIAALAAQAGFALLAMTDPVLPRLPLVAIAVSVVVLLISAYVLPTYFGWGQLLLPAAWLSFGLAIGLRSRSRVVV